MMAESGPGDYVWVGLVLISGRWKKTGGVLLRLLKDSSSQFPKGTWALCDYKLPGEL